jgi:hypothetical protein
MRINFERGKQREFLNQVIERMNSPSLRGILQFGFEIPYSTLKNYYNESRLMPKELVEDLCEISGIDFGSLEFNELGDSWGRVKGGRIGKRK